MTGRSNKWNKRSLAEIRAEADRFYATIVTVRCPYLGKEVHFNRQGIEHLRFKSGRKARTEGDQLLRLGIIRLAPKIVSMSSTVQGIRQGNQFVRVKRNGRWGSVMMPVTYYQFTAVIKGMRATVIVRRVGTGEPHFWSIFPVQKRAASGERSLCDGNPEED